LDQAELKAKPSVIRISSILHAWCTKDVIRGRDCELECVLGHVSMPDITR
jgi:hypothetical protein